MAVKNRLLIVSLYILGCSVNGWCETWHLTDSLDKIIDNKSVYIAEKEQRIKHLTGLLQATHASLSYEYEINLKLYEEYKKFQLDSAIQYIEIKIE
ncbi:MAG: hypothetical protein LIP01_16620 [Tannerellaceae bacterium]|nr:hypothetical protein [Tannerellaceae bacterium]